MKDEENNIRQKPGDRYPEPKVPAESAWADMQKMLDLEIPQGQTIGTTLSTKLWIIISSVILTATGVGMWIMLANVPVAEKDSKKSFAAQNSITSSATKNGFSHPNSGKGYNSDSSGISTKIDKKAPVRPEHAVKDTAHEAGTERLEIRTNKGKSDGYRKANSTIENDKKSSPINNQGLAPSLANAFDSINGKKMVTKRATYENSRNEKTSAGTIEKNKPDYQTHLKAENTSVLSSRETENVSERAAKEYTETHGALLNPDPNSDERSKLKNFSQSPLLVVNLLKIRPGNFEQKRNKLDPIVVLVPKAIETIRKKKLTGKDYINGLDFGLQWQGNLPFKNFDKYFTGSNNNNQFYMLFIPGIWVEKQFNRGNGILAKISPYSQYFGNNQQIATTLTKKSDSVSVATYKNLIKIGGFNAGLRYNQEFHQNWHLGAGFDAQWQQRALLSKLTTNLKNDSISVDSVSYYGIKQTANDSKYLNSFFVTGNLELFYTWKNFRIGGALVVPITSMTTNKAEQKVRPLSGSLFFRWRIK